MTVTMWVALVLVVALVALLVFNRSAREWAGVFSMVVGLMGIVVVVLGTVAAAGAVPFLIVIAFLWVLWMVSQ